MSRVHARFPALCMRRAVGRVRVCVRSPSQHYTRKTDASFFNKDSDDQYFSSNNSSEMMMSSFINGEVVTNPETETGNRVMVVVDSSLAAKTALQWTLSHTVQSQDTILLLHIVKPSKQGVNPRSQRAYELLSSMKNVCQMKRPGVQVEIVLKEGKEKGPIIVEEAKQRKITLLVLGQRKRSIMWRLQMLWAGKRTRNRVVEYCIENAGCMTIAVRMKSRKHGGYLITTKRHKKFWLLA